MPAVIDKPVPHAEAAKFIADKPVLARGVFDQLLPDLQARAFVVSGVEDANVVQAVRDRIAELPQGADWDKVKADIAGQISPWLGDGAERRAELVLRQHGYQAYQAAQYEVMDRQRAVFPYWQYQTAEDDNVRDSHAALNGLVVPADSEFWATHFPPWDWGCRCYVTPLMEDDVAEMKAADADKSADQRRVLDEQQLSQLEKNGIVNRAIGEDGVPRPINVTPGPQAPRFDPGSLKLGAEQLRPRYDAETWANFEKFAKAQALPDGGTVWNWMNKPAAKPGRAKRAPRAAKVEKPVAVAPVPPAQPGAATEASTVEAQRQAMREAVYKTEHPMGNGVNAAVKLTNGKTVIFKAKDAEYETRLRRGIEPGTQYLREVASSIIDEELKLGLVPPTTLINRNGREGSAQLFKEGFQTAGSTRSAFKVIASLPDRIKQDWQLFDDLVNHLDRHGGNYLLRVRGDSADLALIDNGLSLSTSRQGKAYSGPLEGKPIDATNLARLQDLIAREAAITERLKPLLPKVAIDDFFVRARILLTRGTYGDAHD